MSIRIEFKTAVSVCEMARLVGLSRSRFYELIETGVFPSGTLSRVWCQCLIS